MRVIPRALHNVRIRPMLAFSILPCSNWLIQGRLSPVRSDKSAWVSPLMKAVGIEKVKGLRLNSPARDLSDYN